MVLQIAQRDAKPWSYMTSYNRLNGIHCSEDPWLLKTLLRDEWKSDAMVRLLAYHRLNGLMLGPSRSS